jgi:hypothetical protein
MNNHNTNQDIQKALILLERFKINSIEFLRNRNYEIRYKNANIPLMKLLTLTPSLFYETREYLLSDDENYYLLDSVDEILFNIQEELVSISVNCSSYIELEEEIKNIWQIFDEVCNELKELIFCSFLRHYDFDEIIENINERVENDDIYQDDEFLFPV